MQRNTPCPEELNHFRRKQMGRNENKSSNPLMFMAGADRNVFGINLQLHLDRTGRRLALPIQYCCDVVRKYALGNPDLFTLTFHWDVKEIIRYRLERVDKNLGLDDYRDHWMTIGVLLMEYCRLVPETLFTLDPFYTMMQTNFCTTDQEFHNLLRAALDLVPENYLHNIKYIIKLLIDHCHALGDFEIMAPIVARKWVPAIMHNDYRRIYEDKRIKIITTLMTDIDSYFPGSSVDPSSDDEEN